MLDLHHFNNRRDECFLWNYCTILTHGKIWTTRQDDAKMNYELENWKRYVERTETWYSINETILHTKKKSSHILITIFTRFYLLPILHTNYFLNRFWYTKLSTVSSVCVCVITLAFIFYILTFNSGVKRWTYYAIAMD